MEAPRRHTDVSPGSPTSHWTTAAKRFLLPAPFPPLLLRAPRPLLLLAPRPRLLPVPRPRLLPVPRPPLLLPLRPIGRAPNSARSGRWCSAVAVLRSARVATF